MHLALPSSSASSGGVIAKLPPSWRNFATFLKYKRQNISVEDLVASLDVEEKARSKDGIPKIQEEQSSANVMQHAGNEKYKGEAKVVPTTNFKRTNNNKKKVNMEDVICFICGESSHWVKKCRKCMDKKNQPRRKNPTNVTIGNVRASGLLGVLPS